MLTVRSPARIPLFLRVIGISDEGSPETVALNQAIDLSDLLKVNRSEQDSLEPTASYLGPVLSLFRKKTGIEQKFSVLLERKIPENAGLGERYSHSASMLWALNQLTGQSASDHDLEQWGREIDHEIPFFFSAGRSYCGETNTASVSPPSKINARIVLPNTSLSVSQLYVRLSLFDLQDRNLEETLQAYIDGVPQYFNDMEEAAFALHPKLGLLKSQLFSRGFEAAVMVGSGPAFFCLGEGDLSGLDQIQVISFDFICRDPDKWY